MHTTDQAASTGDPQLPGVATPDRATERRLREALAQKGDDYRPRTHHLEPGGAPTYVNRLVFETSPYLLQHAHNPVNWYPWGDAAFERAAREHKPVLVSIGYSTCHWCHVMERESFEDEQIAAYLNEHYVAIKVDREERPDVDDVYMTAVQLMTGHGGWPMNVILTPSREPYFGGTYFPARDGDRGQRYGFLTVLESMREEFDNSPDEVATRAKRLSQALAQATRGDGATDIPGPEALEVTATKVLASHDPRHGGFGSAPKFPRPSNLDFMLRWAARVEVSDPDAAERSRAAVERTLDRMIAGGIHDHVGGGFHRYSVDQRWLVPHFEKMLYDNAQLVVSLLEASQATRDPARRTRYREIAAETLDYLDREMRAPGGGHYSATDADSLNPEGELEEGWFFTWTPDEVRAELARTSSVEEIAAFMAHYQVTSVGDFEGRNILHEASFVADTAQAESFARARATLYQARGERPPPLRDDKILSSWNGLALSAHARAAFVLDDAARLHRSRQLAEFLLDTMRDDQGRLYRSYNEGRAGIRAYLDDYAFVIQGLLDLFEASGERRWLEQARALQAKLDEHYWDDDGGAYFMTADDGEPLLVRQKPDYDGAEPSGNSVAALNLLRLYALCDEPSYRARAEATLAALAGTMSQSGRGVPKLLAALDWHLDRPRQIVVVTAEDPDPLLEVLRNSFVPSAVRVVTSEAGLDELEALVPALEGKRALRGKSTAFVCEQRVCEAPTDDPARFAEQLGALRAD